MEKASKRNAKGQGCFIKCEDGGIKYRKGVGSAPNGKRKVLVVKAATKAACIKKMKEKEEEWNRRRQALSISKANTVEELCSRHLQFQMQNNELKPKSVDRREGTIVNQIGKYGLGHMQVASVTPADIENHIAGLIKKDLSTSSIEKALDVLNAAYEWAVARGELETNPVLQIKRTIKRRLAKLEQKNEYDADVIILSEEEEQKFLTECLRKNVNNGEYKYSGGLYGRLLLHTGMRVGELISLKWKDYDENSGTLTINKSTSVIKNRNKKTGENNYISVQGSTKNQKARVIGLSDEAILDLKLIRGYRPGRDDELICRTRTGEAYTGTKMAHCMETIYSKLGSETKISGLHILRRTFATRMYENGAGVKEIAAYIGDLESTTMQYYIAARKKIKIKDKLNQYVPLPGKKRENVPDANKDVSLR